MDETRAPPESGTSASWVDVIARPAVHPSSPEPELTGQVFADRYEVGERIGHGGFGVVYRGRDTRLDADVALKVLRMDRIAPAQREAYMQRFIEEAKLTAQLRHPGVVTVLDAGLARVGTASRPFIVAELLEGRTLRAWSRDAPPLDQWLEVMIALGEALTFAHGRNVLHRDIKPENVLVLPDGRPKLLDFGLAESSERADRAFDIPLPRLDLRAAGTPGYMPPEQLAGERQTPATDLFAWGVLMRETLTGVPPRARPAAPLRRVEEERDDLLPHVIAVIHHCVELEAARRPSSAAEVAHALREIRGLLTLREGVRVHPVAPGAQPYPGLRPFGAAQAGMFFGREALARALATRLRDTPAWLALEAPSGRGKSSFVRAGLLPELTARELPGPAAWVIELRPGTSLSAALAAQVRGPAAGQRATTAERTPGPPDPPQAPEPPVLAALLAHDHPLIVVIDQLEELASQPARELETMVELIRALFARVAPTLLITAVRSDVLDRLEPIVFEASRALRVGLPPLDDAALRDAIQAPATRAGARVEPALVDALVRDVAGASGALPLLADTMRELWERRAVDALTLADYRALGGLGGAARAWGDALLAACPDRGRLRAALLAAVAHDGARPRGRPLSRREVRAAVGEDVVGETTRELLLGRRGVRPLWTEDEAGDVSWIHESVIGAWPTLASWVADEQRALVARTELEASAAAWVRDGRPRDALLRGEQLAYFGAARSPSPQAIELLEASRRMDQQRARRTRAGLGALVAVALAVAVVMALLQRRAQEQRTTAVAALAEAEAVAAAQHLAQGDRVRARAAVRASLESGDTVSARAVWWRLLEDDVVLRQPLPDVFGNLDYHEAGIAIATDGSAFLVDPATGSSRRVARDDYGTQWGRFTPDGRSFVMSGSEGERLEWRLDDDRVIDHPGRADPARAHAMSLDGRWQVTGHRGGAVVLTQLGSGRAEELLTLGSHVAGVAFSLDSRELAVLSAVGEVEIVTLTATSARRRFATGHHAVSQPPKRNLVYAAGDRLFVNHDDGQVRVYDARTGDRIDVGPLDVFASEQGCMDGTPDGRLVAIPGRDGRVLLWRAEGTPATVSFRAHASEAVCAQLWGGGQKLITTGLERTIAVWDVPSLWTEPSPTPLFRTPTLRMHVQRAPLSPDGRLLAASVQDELWVWRIDRPRLERPDTGHPGEYSFASLLASPEHGLLLASSSSDDRTLRLWDHRSGRETYVEADVGKRLGWPSFSPDGQTFGLTTTTYVQTRTASTARLLSTTTIAPARSGTPIAWSTDGRWRVYSGSYSKPVLVEGARTLGVALPEDIEALARSPDGRSLAVGGEAGVLYLFRAGRWDAPTHAIVLGASIGGLAFHPNGAWLAVSTRDGRIHRIAYPSGRREVLLESLARPGPVALDPAGLQLVVGLGNGDILFHDLTTRASTTVSGHHGVVASLSVEASGKWLVSGGEDGAVRLWDLAAHAPHWRTVMASSAPPEVLTHAGWQRFDGAPVPSPLAAWRERARGARHGDRRGDRVCLLVGDAIELWDGARDEHLATTPAAPGTRTVVAAEPRGCEARTTRPLVSLGSYTVTASRADAAGVLLGTDTGLLIIQPASGGQRTISHGPTTPITAVLRAPGGLLVAGHQRGELVLWTETAEKLHASHLHGAITWLGTDGRYLFAASELGSTQVWDLHTFVRDRCALLREVWPHAGVWKDGQTRAEPPPPDHPCR